MQVFSTWGPLLSTSLAIYKAFRANISVFVSYVMYCDLCFLVFMLNLIFVARKVLFCHSWKTPIMLHIAFFSFIP